MDKRRRVIAGPGQESVWDYPRQPALEPSTRHVKVIFNGVTIAESRRAIRVLAYRHPPVYYIPPQDIRMEYLKAGGPQMRREFDSLATYYTVIVGEGNAERAAWSYPHPPAAYEAIAGYIAFHAARVDACYVDDEPVQRQSDDSYGGWITGDIIGPFKADSAPDLPRP